MVRDSSLSCTTIVSFGRFNVRCQCNRKMTLVRLVVFGIKSVSRVCTGIAPFVNIVSV